jgi:type IV pilus assembly protein PilC
MPKLFYIARDKLGKKITGDENAASPEELIARLQGRDLLVINILTDVEKKERGLGIEATSPAKSKKRHRGVTHEDLALLCRQLATLLGAGVTILKCLDIISEQVASTKLFNTLKSLHRDMEQGLSLHEAMAKYPKVFSELWVNLVESGEAGGNLPVVLGRLANYLERTASFRKKIISALVYPVLLMVAGMGALLFLNLKIIPTFADLFKGFDIKLPLLTQILMAISEFQRKYILVIIVAIAVLIFLFKKYTATREGRLAYEKFKFNLPLFGEFFRALIVERFASNMSTLLESGVPILYSLEITERSVGNLTMADVIRVVKEDVREGKSLSKPLQQSGFFEPMVVQMVSIGEEIGELSQMFKKIDAFYEEYLETFLARFTAMFEPLMLIFMGGVIGIMVVGMFLPIFKIAQIR